VVVRAHHLLAQQEVAIKILRDDMELDEENRQRFLREAQLMVRLRSEHVTKISDVGTLETGAPFVVMELLDGMDLGRVLESAGRLSTRVACDHLLQACDVLAEAHALGIVHRDIKPTNLFVTRRNDGSPSIKVLDFGISKTPSKDEQMKLTQTAMMLGTPAYMSPEQMRSARSVDARTDIWSLGIVLYELVEGTMPFDATSFAELAVKVATEPFIPMAAAPELTPVVARCLGRTPNDRYASVAELALDLARYATPETARTYVARVHRMLGKPVPNAFDSSPNLQQMTELVASPVPRTPSEKRARKWLAITLAFASLCAIFGIALALGRSGGDDKKPEPPPAAKVMTPVPPPAPPAPAPAPTATADSGTTAPVAPPPPTPPTAGVKKNPLRPPTPTVKQPPPPPAVDTKLKCDPSRVFNGRCV
jgi:serine/threonine-protein kinase